MKIAAVQFRSTSNVEDNLSRSIAFFEDAVRQNIELLIFPENILYRGDDVGYKESASYIPGKISGILSELSTKFSIAAIWGGVVEKSDDCLYNTSLFISETGDLIGKYRKIHLFELYDNEQVLFREEDLFRHGDEIINLQYKSFNFGMSICYDLRFPELYLALSVNGADIITVPSDFTQQTGKAHWHPLLRARAIENLSYVIAANQCVQNDKTKAVSYGHSCIINPWGEIVAELDDVTEGLCVADINKSEIESARKRIRSLEHRRKLSSL